MKKKKIEKKKKKKMKTKKAPQKQSCDRQEIKVVQNKSQDKNQRT